MAAAATCDERFESMKNLIQLASVAMLVCSCLTVVQVVADEGMWLFNNLPQNRLKTNYDFEPTEEWTDHLMKA